MTLASLLFGWLLFLDSDLARVQRSVAAQAIFLQNAFFIDNYEDYFRVLPSTQVTLHTWSLAVEEQFYIVFPLFFMAVAGVAAGRRWLSAVLLLATTAALTYFAIVDDAGMRAGTTAMLRPFIANINPSGLRFYALPFRAWELLLGGCVFLVASRAPAAQSASSRALIRAVYIAVLLLLGAAASRAFDEELWPNVEAIGVCLVAAAGLALAAALRGAPRRPTIAGRCFAYLGNTSYSTYLWHFPLLGYFTYTNWDFGRAASDYLLYFGVLALLVAATYHAIEKPRFRITPGTALSCCSRSWAD